MKPHELVEAMLRNERHSFIDQYAVFQDPLAQDPLEDPDQATEQWNEQPQLLERQAADGGHTFEHKQLGPNTNAVKMRGRDGGVLGKFSYWPQTGTVVSVQPERGPVHDALVAKARSHGLLHGKEIPDHLQHDLEQPDDLGRMAALLRLARYPQEYSGEAPYGRIENSGRARNRPPSVLRDHRDPSQGILDPSEIEYRGSAHKVRAYHPNGDELGSYSVDDSTNPPHIGIAQVHPNYQGQGVAGGILDHIRENYHPDLVHSGYGGVGSLSYQGRAGALRDLGNTEEEHDDYFNTTPYNHGDTYPAEFGMGTNDRQREVHNKLREQFEEDRNHPNYTGVRSDGVSSDPDMVDEYGDPYEYGYDSDGDYVGLNDGGKDSEGYSEEGYDQHGYDRDGYDRYDQDDEGYNRDGFNDEDLNRDGETRHGYVPGNGEPVDGTVPMSEMLHHMQSEGLPMTPEHQEMLDDAARFYAPTMYAVRGPHDRSSDDGSYQIGNGDTVHSSLERARQVAYHPTDPDQDRDIVSADHLDPDYLHGDEAGENPEDFHYAPDTNGEADGASTEASLVRDPQRLNRILSRSGPGWSREPHPESPFTDPNIHPVDPDRTLHYADPGSGRHGSISQTNNGQWRSLHQPEFGRAQSGRHNTHRDAMNAVEEGTQPGPDMDQHAMVVNNDYNGTGQGEVEWEPHPNGAGLRTRTPHGDAHIVQNNEDGRWHPHVGPHGFEPGDMRGRKLQRMINRGQGDATPEAAASRAIDSLRSAPYHGGLADELGEGWRPHPTSNNFYSKRLPSGNHGFIGQDGDRYTSGIQSSDRNGHPSGTPNHSRISDSLPEALDFIRHRENPVLADELGPGWEGTDMGRRYFPSYRREDHPSGRAMTVARGREGWQPAVFSSDDRDYEHGPGDFDDPRKAAAWAHARAEGLL